MNRKILKVKLLIIFLVFVSQIELWSQKQVYIPTFITDQNMDLNDNNSQWSYERSVETADVVIFWEPGFGQDPSNHPSPFTIDMSSLLQTLSQTYDYYIDSLEFAKRGSSVTDQYKLMVFLLYTTDWAAFGSGQDDLVGSLFVNPAAANSAEVVAHEVGHCFQYIAGCDTDGGYRYGYGPNGEGGNGFWEQCAQWMAFKAYPNSIMQEATAFANNSHLHALHENNRYQNYYITEYWSTIRGLNAIGTLWRESTTLEDPIQTYQRIYGINQSVFNDEIYEYASKLTTWDLPSLYPYNQNYLNINPDADLIPNGDQSWISSPEKSIESYGFNSIRLNVPTASIVSVKFEGLIDRPEYRIINAENGGWRFGFVALLEDGTRHYSEMASCNVTNGEVSPVSLDYQCPDKCEKLWLVISGAPQSHVKHEWDDHVTNDEQWPYMVSFTNTDKFGFNQPISNLSLTYDVIMAPMDNYDPVVIRLDENGITNALALTTSDIANQLGSTIKYYAKEPNGDLNFNSTANAPGHWFDKDGRTTNWGSSAFVYGELDIFPLEMRIGQYPGRTVHGDSVVIKQGLLYQKSPTEVVNVDLTFKIKFVDATVSTEDQIFLNGVLVYPNPVTSILQLSHECAWQLYTQMGQIIQSGEGSTVEMAKYPPGIYLIKTDRKIIKIVKR